MFIDDDTWGFAGVNTFFCKDILLMMYWKINEKVSVSISEIFFQNHFRCTCMSECL